MKHFPILSRRLKAFSALIVIACLCAVQAPAQGLVEWNTAQKIIFEDAFHSGSLDQWRYSIENQKPSPVNSDRIGIVPAPGRYVGNAVRFELPGKAGTFRTELALHPAEKGLQERWYSQSVAVDATTDTLGFIVMQWHALMGGDRVDRNFPNLAISVKDDRWVIKRAFGSPAKIQRETFEVPERVVAKKWADWVVRVRWSEGSDGRVDAWLDGRQVYTATGPNVYQLAKKTTPYFKTGIYRAGRKGATTDEPPTVVHVRNVKVGRQDATFADMRPPRQDLWQTFANQTNDKCLDVVGGVVVGRLLITWPCSNSENQRFRPNADGELRVGSLCLAVVGGNHHKAGVAAANCNGSLDQKWNVEWDATIRSLLPGTPRCLDLAREDGDAVSLWACAPSISDQRFRSNPLVALVNPGSGRCLDVSGGVVAGRRLIGWNCHGGANQTFQAVTVPNHRIRVGDLCVNAASAALHADVNVETCNNSANQAWVVDESNGAVRSLMPGGTSYCMDVDTEQGGNITLMACWPSSPDQQFAKDPWQNFMSNVDGLCLDAPGSPVSRRVLITFRCHGGINQKFHPTVSGLIQSGHACLAVVGDSRDGAAVVADTCTGKQDQKWTVAWDGTIRSQMPGVQRCMGRTGSTIVVSACMPAAPAQQFRRSEMVEFINLGSVRCWDVRGGVRRGGSLQIQACNGGVNQTFKVEPNYELRVGSLCVNAASAAESANVTLEACNNSDNQQWKIDTNGTLRSLLPGAPYCIAMSGETVSMRKCSPKDMAQRFEPV